MEKFKAGDLVEFTNMDILEEWSIPELFGKQIVLKDDFDCTFKYNGFFVPAKVLKKVDTFKIGDEVVIVNCIQKEDHIHTNMDILKEWYIEEFVGHVFVLEDEPHGNRINDDDPTVTYRGFHIPLTVLRKVK
jgi:hypothetical protein